VLDVGGEHPDAAAVGLASVNGRDLREPAVDPAARAAGDKDDAAVGQIARLNVIVTAAGELAQSRAVGVNLVKVIVRGAAGPVGKNNLGSVFMYAGIAYRPCGIIHQKA